MNKSISLLDIVEEYKEINSKIPSYRFGQHFIVCCIKDSSGDFYHKLWNEDNFRTAYSSVIELCTEYNWDLMNLVDIRETKYNKVVATKGTI